MAKAEPVEDVALTSLPALNSVAPDGQGMNNNPASAAVLPSSEPTDREMQLRK